MNNCIDYLIISNKNDFTSDFICIKLDEKGEKYLRINRDEFSDYKIIWDVNENIMTVEINWKKYKISNELKGVYYRAPVYIRYFSNSTKEEQLYKSQWMAFIKNMICFENAIWINNPVETYKAENKMIQLKYAKELGFNIPKTKVINGFCEELNKNDKYIIKSIDTLLLRYEGKEAFLYSNVVTGDEINSSSLSIAPIVVQEFLNPKIDLRVTVINNTTYTVQILKNGKGTYGDWRREKDNVEFIKYTLPDNLVEKCILLVKKLNLVYGAIDLAVVNNEYFFIEINPTGEWAWLLEIEGFDIDERIVKAMSGD